MPINNDWNEHRLDVLKTLTRVERKLDRIETELVSIQRDLAFNRGKTYAIAAFVAAGVSILTAFGGKVF